MLQQVTLTVQKVRKSFIQLRKERKTVKLIDCSLKQKKLNCSDEYNASIDRSLISPCGLPISLKYSNTTLNFQILNQHVREENGSFSILAMIYGSSTRAVFFFHRQTCNDRDSFTSDSNRSKTLCLVFI